MAGFKPLVGPGTTWTAEGVDVSHHQPPTKMHYDALPGNGVVIARATYGTKPDKAYAEHVKRARAAGKRVGAYHFFRPSQDWKAQYDAFLRAANLQRGDVAPVLDIEQDPFPAETYKRYYTKAHYATAQDFALELRDLYGECILYGGAHWLHDFCGRWVLDYPVWTAHYRGANNRLGPSAPKGMRLVGWQYEGRHNTYLPEVYPGGPALDVNVFAELPVCVGGGL